MEYKPAFLIDSQENIISKLYTLFKNKCLFTVYFGDNDDSFITTIHDINRKDNVFIFHYGPKEESIEQLLNSSKITFKTELLGVEVVFDTMRLARIKNQGVFAFAVPVPASMLWMERREFYRMKSPVSKSSYCQVTLKDQESINLKLYDISLGGFSMLTDSKKVSDLSKNPDLMALYTSFEQCKLILADTGEYTISFEVRNKHIINPGNLNRMEKIGCKFTRIMPACENAIQHYMQQIERENRKKY
jgi:flagellar brake protein